MALIRRCIEHWPVALILAIPLCGITASMIAVSQAISQPPQMVNGDYQRLGKALVDNWQAEQRAAQLDLQASLNWRGEQVILQLQPGQAMVLPERLQLLLAHPVDTRLDRHVWLQRQHGGDYTGSTLRPAFQGSLTLAPEGAPWRLHGRLTGAASTRLSAGVQGG